MNQLAIALETHPSYAADDFIVSPSNQRAHDLIMSWPDWSGNAIWLYGPTASGRSHLATMWASVANAQSITLDRASDIETALQSHSASFLIDDIDTQLASHEETCFHLLNHAKASNTYLLLVAQSSPNHCQIRLPDLHSRLNALPTAKLTNPDDVLLKALWYKLFSDRQLQVPTNVIDYLVQHSDRSFDRIQNLVREIDTAALREKRRISIPFIKTLLQE